MEDIACFYCRRFSDAKYKQEISFNKLVFSLLTCKNKIFSDLLSTLKKKGEEGLEKQLKVNKRGLQYTGEE